MLRNYFLITIRNLTRNYLGTIITIVGFSCGIAAAVVIMAYVNYELSYDQFHKKAERIYRIHLHMTMGGEEKEGPVSPNILGPVLKEKVPQVEEFVRLYYQYNMDPVIYIGEENFKVDNFFFADSTLFNVFTVDFIRGSGKGVFKQREDAIISEKTAIKYFKSKEVLGKIFYLSEEQNFIIRGVYKDFPENSHIRPNIIASAISSTINRELSWGGANYYTYLLLTSGTSPSFIEQKIADIIQTDGNEWVKNSGMSYTLFPLLKIHLYSRGDFEPSPVGDMDQVYAFILIAVFIVLIACVNYINLSTSKSLERAKEVGLRKMMGGTRKQLIFQFLVESFVITFLSIILSILILTFIGSSINQMLDRQILNAELLSPNTLFLFIISSLILSLVAGTYPAFILTSFHPIQVMRSSFKKSASGILARKSLVVFQFVISIGLIVGTLIVYKQINYMSHTKLGFDKDHVLVLPLFNITDKMMMFTLKDQLKQHSNIRSVSICSAYPTRTSGGQSIRTEAMDESEESLIWQWRSEPEILDALGVNLIAGRNFIETDKVSDSKRYIINQTTAKMLDWEPEECIGKKIYISGGEGICIGVVEDFHFTSLKNQVEPLVFNLDESFMRNLIIRLGEGDVMTTMNYIEEKWEEMIPGRLFDYLFLDESFDNLYKNERKAGKLFAGFTLLAILIACLGLFGLSIFEAQVRTKEIGIRKVMGSSSVEIFRLLVRGFTSLVFIGFLISVPLTVFIMKEWLNGFAYRINIGAHEFLLAALVIFIILMMSVSYHAIKAAIQNPVDSLRYE